MLNKTKTVRIISIFILSTLLLSILLTLGVSAEASSTSSYDLSREGSSHNKEMNSAELLEKMLGEELSTAERAYLVSYGDLSVKYDDGITTAFVSAMPDDGRLTVNAYEYSYTSVSGGTVTWIPAFAELAGETQALVKSSDAYVAVFEGFNEQSGVERVNVTYTLKVQISEEDALALLNQAKNDIPTLEAEIEEKTKEFERLSEEHSLAEEKYLDYLEELESYGIALEKYEEYLKEYRIYSEKLAEYNQYLIDLEKYSLQLEKREQYEKDLQAYRDAYPLYVVYLQEKKEYDLLYAEYTKYAESVNRFRDRLAILEYANTPQTALKRSAVAAINGNVVTSVLAERDSLESNLVGAPPKVIDLAGNATDRLRALLKDYYSYTTDQGRYTYYQQNYQAIRDSFVDLFISLDYLYKNASVRAVLYETERDEKYRILVAQLYLIAHALSDTPIKSVSEDLVAGSKDADKYKQFTYTSSYNMDVYKYTVSDILGKDGLLTDKNTATPINEPFPTEVPEPTAPTVVEKPVEPEYVAEPEEVSPVEHPGEPPVTVDDPGEPPTEVLPAGEAPEEYIPPKEFTDLIAIKADVSHRNADFSGGYTLVLEKTVSKKFINPDEVNVKFYSENGEVLLYETTVDSGTGADYYGIIPTKEEDDRAVYLFDGWCDSDGERVSLSSVGRDVNLYPIFKETIKEYSVIFDVDGVITEERIPYGTLPEYSGKTPERADTDLYTYTFIGWDKEISPVTGDVEYKAAFSSEYIVPTTQGGATVTYGDGVVIVDYGFAFDRSLKLYGALSRAAEYGSLLVKTPYLTVEVSFRGVRELLSENVDTVKLEVTETSASIRLYELTVLDREGNSVSTDVSFKLTDKTVRFEYNDRLKLYTTDGQGERRYMKFALEGKKLEYTAKANIPYTLSYEYSITLAADASLGLSADRELYSNGENVTLSMTLPDNVKLVRFYYVTSDGVETELTHHRFTMPSSDVTVVCEVEYVRYLINFVSEDTVISSFYCIKGEMPAVPETPKKLSDGEFNYVFVGWSEEVCPANGDVTYHAVFEAVPVEAPPPVEQGMTIYQKATFVAAVVIGVFVIIIASAIAIKMRG